MDIFMTACGGVETSIIECNGGGDAGIWAILILAANIFTGIIGVLAVIGIIITGIQYTTAAGDTVKTAKAKRRLIEIIIGIAAYLLVYALLQWLVPGGLMYTETIPAENITLSLSKNRLYVGESTTVKVRITPDDATNKTFSLSSSDTSIVSASGGNVKCLKDSEGKAITITATAFNGKTATDTVTCAPKPEEKPEDVSRNDDEPVEDLHPVLNKNVTNEDGSAFTAHYDPKTSTDYTFRITDRDCNEDCSNVTNITIDGQTLVANTDYEVRRGSIIVKIYAKTMKSLKSGDHEILVETDDENEPKKIDTLVGSYLTEDEVRKYNFEKNPTYDDIVQLLRLRGIDENSDDAKTILSWVEGEGYWGKDRYLGYLSACVIINNILAHSYGNDPLAKMESWGSYYSKANLLKRAEKAKTNQFSLRPIYLALKYLRTGIHQCWGPKVKPASTIYTGYNSKNEAIYVF